MSVPNYELIALLLSFPGTIIFGADLIIAAYNVASYLLKNVWKKAPTKLSKP